MSLTREDFEIFEKLLDKSLEKKLQPIRSDISELKKDVSVLKEDVSGLKEDNISLKERMTRLELHIENTTDKHIRILAENHLELINKMNENLLFPSRSRVNEVKMDVLFDQMENLKERVQAIENKIA